MTLEPVVDAEHAGTSSAPAAWLFVGGVASIGAGAVHAAAAGAHGDHPRAVWVFTVLGLLQLTWGGLALARRGPAVAFTGMVLGMGSVIGWALAKTVGLTFVQGLDVPEPVTFADASAAVLAAVGATAAGLSLSHARSGPRGVPALAALLLVGTATAGTIATSAHHHDEEVAGHVHGTTTAATTAHLPTGSVATALHTTPYDPTMPIDLSGTPGVTPQQQARAENLVATTLLRLPHWSDPAVAEKAGFRSIGDGFTGVEHLVNKAFLRDEATLDPDRPESLVYDTSKGGRTLVAAMYMVAPGTPLSKVPDIGGALMQWHVHENLCYFPNGMVAALTRSDGTCPAGLVKPVPTPMIHVWITPNRCGPFAALEGVGGGQIAAGQARLCDHVHGSSG